MSSLARDPPNAPKMIFCSPGFVARSPGQFPPIDTASNAPKPMWQPEIMPMRNSLATDPDAFFCPMSTAFWYICGGGFTEGALAAAGTGAAVLPPATTGAAAVDIMRLLVLYCCRGAKVLRKAAGDATALEEASGMAPRADRKASDPGARRKARERIEEKPILTRVVDEPGSLLLCLAFALHLLVRQKQGSISRQLLEPILEPVFKPRGRIRLFWASRTTTMVHHHFCSTLATNCNCLPFPLLLYLSPRARSSMRPVSLAAVFFGPVCAFRSLPFLRSRNPAMFGPAAKRRRASTSVKQEPAQDAGEQ